MAAANAWLWSAVLTVSASILPDIVSNSLRKSVNPAAAGNFLILACNEVSSQSHNATTSPWFAAWSRSPEPLPPTPIPATRRRSLAPHTRAGAMENARAAPEDTVMKRRRSRTRE